MLNVYLLRFHRWLTLAFAAPLAVVSVTGLLLSLPPILQTISIKPQSLTLEKVEALLAQYDPQGQASSLRLDTYQNLLTIGSTDVDLATGMEANEEDWLSDILGPSRGIHQRLVFELGWLVIASTGAMLVIMALGLLMGWPRFSNSASGWHKGTAWVCASSRPRMIYRGWNGYGCAAGANSRGLTMAPGNARSSCRTRG